MLDSSISSFVMAGAIYKYNLDKQIRGASSCIASFSRLFYRIAKNPDWTNTVAKHLDEIRESLDSEDDFGKDSRKDKK